MFPPRRIALNPELTQFASIESLLQNSMVGADPATPGSLPLETYEPAKMFTENPAA
jgi:hypothetical protein